MCKASHRPFRANYPEQARKLCLLGAIDRELAGYFEVSESTVNRWKRQHPEFAEALRLGKAAADAEVAEALYARAVKGDLAAISFWLRNRRPDLWRDKRDGPASRAAPAAAVDIAGRQSEACPEGQLAERELAKAIALILKRGVNEPG